MLSVGTSNGPQVCILDILQGLSFISYTFATMHWPSTQSSFYAIRTNPSQPPLDSYRPDEHSGMLQNCCMHVWEPF
jgi:hypothetical protein